MLYYILEPTIKNLDEVLICNDIGKGKAMLYLSQFFINSSLSSEFYRLKNAKSLRVSSVGKDSPAHKLAYRVKKGKEKPNLKLTKNMIYKKLFNGKK